MNFTEKRKHQNGILSLADLKRDGLVSSGINESLFVKGPREFDCLKNKWSRQELTGIIGDSGTGKSETVLTFFKDILVNNPQSCGVYVSLEMTTSKIAQRWFQMTEECPEVSERLYVISRYDNEGVSRDVSMDWIKKELVKYKNTIGDVIAFTIDHIHCIGDNDSHTLNSIMIKLKEMSVELNAHGFPMAQVNKTSGQKGEVPLDSDSVLACSQFKYICSDIIQIHRPILRLEGDAGFSVLGWGYCKVREASPDDKVKRGQNRLLVYDDTLRNFRKLSNEESVKFKLYYDQILELKSSEDKFKAYAYDMSKEIHTSSGKIVTINEKFCGSGREDL